MKQGRASKSLIRDSKVTFNCKRWIQGECQSLEDLRGLQGTHAPPPAWASKLFQFHAVCGKMWQNRVLVPPGGLAPPPQGNPGSTNADIALTPYFSTF